MLDADGWPIVAASAVPFKPGMRVPREMTRADMDRVREDFVRAIENGGVPRPEPMMEVPVGG